MGFRRRCFVLGCALWASGCATDANDERSWGEPLAARPESKDDWVLVFADEFDASAVDTSFWSPLSGDLVHPSTSNSASPEMASTRDGSLFISTEPTPDDETFPYRSAYLETRGRFAQTYGKVEFRARGQYAPGLWYAVWARPWENAIPEIDIEFLAENVNQAWFVSHWDLPPAPADQRRRFTTVSGIDITYFHTYSVVWNPELVEWQIDGEPYMRVTGAGVPHEPMFWVMNAWVGGWAGKPGKGTIFPARFEVDWFRVYRQRAWLVEPSIRVVKPKDAYGADETIDVDLADFERTARVEVREGDHLLATLPKPPFRFAAKNLGRGRHDLDFTGSDGARSATTKIVVNVR